MRIGVDIDGVLTDIEQYQIDYGTKYFYLKYGKEIIDYKGYDWIDMFDVSKKLDNECWVKYIDDYCKEPARHFAGEVTNMLKDEGNEIYIITARYLASSDTPEGEAMRITVKEWLKKYNIYYDKIIFSPEDKADICKENKIDLMIEDKPANINNISKFIPVICFNAGYNEKCVGHNITRCYSWYDIYAKISKMKNK